MSPTSSRVTDPTDTSWVADRDSGRITVRAPVKSSWVRDGGYVVTGPSSCPQCRLAHPGPEVGAHETWCAISDLVELEVVGRHVAKQHLQQCLAGGAVGQAEAELTVAPIQGSQARFELVGLLGRGHQRHPRSGDRLAQFGRIIVATGSARGAAARRYRDQQHTTAVHGVATPTGTAFWRSGAASAPASGPSSRPAGGLRRPPAPGGPSPHPPVR